MGILNGSSPQSFPKIEIFWDAGNQQAGIRFNNDEFKNPMFVIAIVGMAAEGLKAMVLEAQARAAQQQMAQAAQEAKLLRNLKIN